MASYRIVVLPGSGLVTASVEKGGNLFPCPILISNPGLRLNYFRFQKNGWPPYWNSISGFEFDVCIVIGMSFCIRLPNFVVIGR